MNEKGNNARYISLKFEKYPSEIRFPYVDPSNYIDPNTAEIFINCYLLLQIITLS